MLIYVTFNKLSIVISLTPLTFLPSEQSLESWTPCSYNIPKTNNRMAGVRGLIRDLSRRWGLVVFRICFCSFVLYFVCFFRIRDPDFLTLQSLRVEDEVLVVHQSEWTGSRRLEDVLIP